MKRFFLATVAAMVLMSVAPAGSELQAQETKTQKAGKAAYLETGKVYTVQSFKFTVQSAAIHKGSYPMGMFSGRPSNPDMDPAFDGVLGIVLNLKAGNSDAFSELDKYLLDEKGRRNVKADAMEMASETKCTVLFNVPLTARKLTFCIGSLKLNLEKELSKAVK
ncbi:MAG: hypothetical protein LBC98_07080 [Prevotellaceae bacterium]|jgi:hypothetical protein|nr:hypothetical protein [Prevotellaceae bacterium]